MSPDSYGQSRSMDKRLNVMRGLPMAYQPLPNSTTQYYLRCRKWTVFAFLTSLYAWACSECNGKR